MDLIKHKIRFLNEDFFFFAPLGDDCPRGTLAGLQKNDWGLDKIDFKSGDIFCDIGCNVGIVSMAIAKLFPYAMGLSFDPNPLAIHCLKMGCRENKINNLCIYNLAIGDKTKTKAKFVTYSENETCTVEAEIANKRDFSYLSDILSVDELFDTYLPNKQVKFLKCDIEGGEFKLFDHLFDNRPDLLDRIENLHLEIHPFDDSNPPTKKLKEQVIKKFGNRVKF